MLMMVKSAEAGVFVAPLALEADYAAEAAGRQQTLDRRAGEDQLFERRKMKMAGNHHRARILLSMQERQRR
jgi:hypothetical protein